MYPVCSSDPCHGKMGTWHQQLHSRAKAGAQIVKIDGPRSLSTEGKRGKRTDRSSLCPTRRISAYKPAASFNYLFSRCIPLISPLSAYVGYLALHYYDSLEAEVIVRIKRSIPSFPVGMRSTHGGASSRDLKCIRTTKRPGKVTYFAQTFDHRRHTYAEYTTTTTTTTTLKSSTYLKSTSPTVQPTRP
ncbi:hypothetical protein L209DRAFT_403995 [Thermothelomyces heterothallicus CBS 203.75]